MNIIFLGQKPIGEKIFFFANDNIKNIYVCSNPSKMNWWKSNKIYHVKLIKILLTIKVEMKQVRKNNFKKKKIKFIFSIQHKWVISKKIIDLVNGNAFNTSLYTSRL